MNLATIGFAKKILTLTYIQKHIIGVPKTFKKVSVLSECTLFYCCCLEKTFGNTQNFCGLKCNILDTLTVKHEKLIYLFYKWNPIFLLTSIFVGGAHATKMHTGEKEGESGASYVSSLKISKNLVLKIQ
jgi:hypothetical protein